MTRRLLPAEGLSLILLFLLIYILPLGARPLIIPDEVRYAEIPREMIASGDWVVPRLNGLRYFEKPVMGYWLTAAALKLFGHNAFAARFASAAGAGLGALMIFMMVRRFEYRDMAFSAAAIYLSMGLVMGLGTYNVLDGPLTLFITAAMAAFFFACRQPPGSGRKVLWLVLCGFFCGCGFLIKGFVAFAVPAVSAFPYMIWQRRFKELLIIGWIPLFAALLTVMPWALVVHQREPGFWHFFIFNEHLRRFMADSAQHSAGFWYYLALLPAAALPWTVLAPAAAMGLKRAGRQSDLLRWAICWFLFPLLFFSISRGKILTYILPCFAPLAIILAYGFHHLPAERPGKILRVGTAVLALCAILVAAALAAVQMSDIYGLRLYAAPWRAAVVIASTLLCALMIFSAGRQQTVKRAIAGIAAAPVALMLAMPFALPDATLVRKTPCDFLRRQAPRVTSASILVADERPLLAVCWVYRRSDVYQLGAGGELTYGLSHDDAGDRLMTPAQLKNRIRQAPGRVILVISAEKYAPLKASLPPPSFEARNASNGFVFVQF